MVVETNLNTSPATWTRGEIFAAGRHIATYSGGTSGTTNFIETDWLGTERVRANHSGAVCETITSLPFGDGQSISGSCGDPSPLHFTGKERDPESGLDNFGTRYNASSFGRFLSPDLLSLVALPVDSRDPQSWDAYAYARNNPLNLTDPDGTNYLVCQSGQTVRQNNGDNQEGYNCADLTDEQYAQFRKDNPNLLVTSSGEIQVQNANGGFTTIGQEIHYKEQDVQAARQLRQWGTVVTAAGVAELVVLGPYASGLLAGVSPEIGITELGLSGLGAAGLGNGEVGLKGPSSDYIDVTQPGSRFPNRLTNVTAKEFGENLESQGFTKSQRGDVTTYTKGNTQYTVYTAISTGGPTAQVNINGRVQGKIRLQP